jgi:leucyl aminopeptidase (aminopeptidase T)
MTKAQQILTSEFSETLIKTMFQVKKGETVAITIDLGSKREIVEALAKATQDVGGIPLLMWIPKAEKDSQAGMKDWPVEALTAALCKADVWIEANSVVLLYSDIWETAMKDNKKLRYLIIADSSIESLHRVFTGYEIGTLKNLLSKVTDMAMTSKKVRITSKNGTDVSYNIDLNYTFDYDDGDFSKPKFGTAPGFVNIVPKLDSMNGVIIFDHLQHTDNNSQIKFIMKNGKITEVSGGKAAEKFKSYLTSFNDENMYKISHNMLGLNPKVRDLTYELVEDERIWGGVDFGFGHTSVMDMPPFGQEAVSHFDGVVKNTSIYFDHKQITNNGVVCHEDLKPLAEKLIK